MALDLAFVFTLTPLPPSLFNNLFSVISVPSVAKKIAATTNRSIAKHAKSNTKTRPKSPENSTKIPPIFYPFLPTFTPIRARFANF